MKPAEKIIAAFGGCKAASEKLGIGLTTVQSWHKMGWIPVHRQAYVLTKARALGLNIFKVDFFPSFQLTDKLMRDNP